MWQKVVWIRFVFIEDDVMKLKDLILKISLSQNGGKITTKTKWTTKTLRTSKPPNQMQTNADCRYVEWNLPQNLSNKLGGSCQGRFLLLEETTRRSTRVSQLVHTEENTPKQPDDIITALCSTSDRLQFPHWTNNVCINCVCVETHVCVILLLTREQCTCAHTGHAPPGCTHARAHTQRERLTHLQVRHTHTHTF